MIKKIIQTVNKLREDPNLLNFIEYDLDKPTIRSSNVNFINECDIKLVDSLTEIELAIDSIFLDEHGMLINNVVKQFNKVGFDIETLDDRFMPYGHCLNCKEFVIFFS